MAERVPSGAMTSEIPSRSRCTAGSRASRALAGSPRSTNATSARRKASPKPGAFASSFLATAVKPPRSSLASTSTSSWLWWLKRNTAGRVARCSAPWTSSRTPARALPSSPPSVMPRSTASRREPLSAPTATPAAKPPSSPPTPAAVRASSAGPAAAARPEPGDRPGVVPGGRHQPAAGVERPRPADGAQEGHVLVAVGVREALRPGRCRAPAAKARTAAALPARHSSGPPGRPVQMPSSISTGETRMCSTPMARAAGSTWKRVADEARTTVWPACRWAVTSRHASG